MSVRKVRQFATCTGCGSDLAGRYVETKRKADGTAVDIYKCPCGRGRRIVRAR